jgi:geranylgeranyl diphosphate synthase type I
MIADTFSFLESRKGLILGTLHGLPDLSGARDEGSLKRIVEFCSRGKMIRGCLVFLGAQAEGLLPASRGPTVERSLPGVAAAMELFQAGLLAHDDIMDRDLTRRGAPTIHARYESEAREAGCADAAHLGEALGICLGDLCYFEAYALLERSLAGLPRSGEVIGLCSSVLSGVAVAQMSDVAWGAGTREPTEDEILAMYRGKTARYSFSLPLAAGALVADDPELASALSALGDELGMLFQIRDDELGLFGSPGEMGKTVGSDLREGKKTLFRARLIAAAAKAGKEERERITRAFTPGERDEDELSSHIDYIRDLARRLGVTAGIAAMSEEAESKANAILSKLSTPSGEARAALEGLVEYVTRRDK